MTKTRSYVWIGISIFLVAILLAQNNLPKAFAISWVAVTPNAIALTADSCASITASSTKLWMACGNTSSTTATLYVMELNGLVLDSLALPNTAVSSDQILPCFSGQCVLYMDAINNDIRKYTWNGADIVSSGTFSSGTCSSLGSIAHDSNGFVWFTCVDTDSLGVLNPTTMTEVTITRPDLTDGAGVECDSPIDVAIDLRGVGATGLGFLNCTLNDQLVSFSYSLSPYGSSVTLLDGESIDLSTTGSILSIDPLNNRLFTTTASATGLTVLTYVHVTGLITTVGTIGNAVQFSGCLDDSFLGVSEYHVVCVFTDLIQVFSSDTDAYALVANIGDFDIGGGCSTSSLVGSYNSDDYYVSNNCLNTSTNDYFVISDVLSISDDPDEPPDGGTPPEPADCNPPFVDLDSDGVCDNPAFAGGGGQNVTDIGNDFFCTIGIIPCANGEPIDSDIETNGVGYLLFLIMLIVFMALATLAVSGKKTSNVHVMLYVIVIIGTSGFASAVNWIPQEILYVSILAVIALGAVKITTLISGARE